MEIGKFSARCCSGEWDESGSVHLTIEVDILDSSDTRLYHWLEKCISECWNRYKNEGNFTFHSISAKNKRVYHGKI